MIKKRVLIVDDNSTNLYMLETLLKGHGIEVTSAENGKDALDKARLNPPDLIVSDILMPVMDGYTLCRHWKSDEQLKHIPFVFYTATYTEPKDEDFALSLGADRFILKPQEPEILMNILKEVLEAGYTVKQVEAKPLGEEMEFFRQHNEILFNKLEKKMVDLETANRKLKCLEEQYRLSFENVTDIVWTIDADLNVRKISPSVERMLGYKSQDFIGRSVSELVKILTPESMERAMVEISLVLSGQTIPTSVYSLVTRDGTIKHCEFSGAPIRRGGKIVGMVSVIRDITERKQAEEVLKTNKSQLSTALEIAHLGHWEYDVVSDLFTFNDQFYKIFRTTVEKAGGYTMPSAEYANRFVHPDDMNMVVEETRKAIETKDPNFSRQIEHRMLYADGTVGYITVRFFIVKDSHGRTVKTYGVNQDITEHKQAEEHIYRQSKLLTAINNVFFETLTADSEESVARVCLKVAQELTGSKFGFIGEITPNGLYSTTALSNPGWEACRIPETQANILIKDMVIRGIWGQVILKEQSLIVNDPASYPDRVGIPEGHPPLTSFLGVPLKDKGKVIGMIAMANRESGYTADNQQDMEALSVAFVEAIHRKRAEEMLKKQLDLFERITETSPVGITLVDSDGSIRFANLTAEKILGLKKDEVTDRVYNDPRWHIVDESGGPFPEEELPFFRVMNTGSAVYNVRHGIKWPDGRSIILSINAAPLKDDSDRVTGMVASLQDITEQKRIEEELLKADKLESVGLLAGGIAHDFNNILTSILGNISMARMKLKPGHKAYDLLSAAETASMRAQGLTRQLLTFAKGGMPVKEVFSIKNILKESSLFVLTGSKSRCEFSIAEDLWPVEADLGQISQVISNLLINANQAMPDGGVIQIFAGNKVIEEEHGLPVKNGRYIMINIKDQGMGIDERHLAKIFDPYFSTKQTGRGLGLASSYSIIKKHDGQISVDSLLGAGTTFNIYLPASDKEIPVKEEAVLSTGCGKILMMDDDEFLKELAKEMLDMLGYESGFAENGAEAIEMYKKARESGKPYDAVILDLTIPGSMGGEEVIKILLEMDPEVKAIVFSGYAEGEVMSNFREYGFKGMMPKPFDAYALGKVLSDVLKQDHIQKSW